MSAFIASMIIKRAEKSIEEGKKLYKRYFIDIKLYERWRKEVDTILSSEGYSEVIVTE